MTSLNRLAGLPAICQGRRCGWVERGEFPDDEKALRTIVEGICYRNALAYFGF